MDENESFTGDVLKSGHHIDDGNNVVHKGAGYTGNDIFYAAVKMSRMPMTLADARKPDQPLIFVNRAFCNLTGYEWSEIIGQNCRFLQGERTDKATVGRLRSAIMSGTDAHEEILNYRKDGSSFWNALYMSPVYDDESGEILYIFGSQLDVTDKKEKEFALLNSRKLEAMGVISSGVAHEYNNMLQIILGSIDRLQGRTESTYDLELLDRARWAAQQSANTISQVLTFSRRQHLSTVASDLNKVISDIERILRQLVGRSVELVFNIGSSPLPLLIDIGQLQLCLVNMVKNSLEAGASEVRVAAAHEGGEALLTVQDNGCGMSREVRERATEPFFSTKLKMSGTGLGLSTVYGFIKQSGGDLEIISTPSSGCEIKISLPLVTEVSS